MIYTLITYIYPRSSATQPKSVKGSDKNDGKSQMEANSQLNLRQQSFTNHKIVK